jgi:hypothetical protein
MQIRQLEALQAMARTSGSKVVFVPMNLNANLSGMSSTGYDQVAQQIAASAGEGQELNPSNQAGLLTSVSNV